MINETKRQAYLRAMDIQVYFPKTDLQGAKSSPVYDISITNESTNCLSHPNTNKDKLAAVNELRTLAAKSKKAPELQLRDEEHLYSQARNREKQPANSATQSIQTSVEPVQQQAGESTIEEELRFNLLYFRISDELAVIDEVPYQGSEQGSQESLILLQAILKALGQEIDASELKSEAFLWPLATGYSMKNPPSVEAAKALSGFLQMRHETDGYNNLLIFTEQLEKLLGNKGSAQSGSDFASGKGYFITLTSSLHSILVVPALKREVWQQLQALKRRIDK